MRKLSLLAAGLLSLATYEAFAQQVFTPQVSQTGSVTANDMATWASNGVIQDGGAVSPVTTGTITAAGFIPTSATATGNRLYLPAANTIGLSARSLGIAQFTNPASGVNQFIFTGTATGGLNTIAAGGSGADATAPILLGGNSTGAVYLGGTTAANAALQAQTVASSVNQIVVTSAATGNIPSIALGGSGADANRNLRIAPAGTGSTIFGTAGTANGGIQLSGSSSGTTAITPAAAATGTFALPAITGTQTIATVNPTPVACGAACTLGALNSNAYTRLDTASGSVATLPSATGTGNTYKLYVSVANSSNADKILLTTTTDTIIGTAIGENGGTAKVFVGNASTYHSIQMPFAGTQPSGGFVGDTVVCTDVASTIWKCDIQYQAGATPTTPYSAGTT